MGCHWISMGKDLMKIDVFKTTFDRCAVALKPYNIDLYHIVCTEDRQIFDDILYCFVAITSIQVSLTDVLHHLGIYPDGITGHSMGEVGKFNKH